jgi:hypothetical protein
MVLAGRRTVAATVGASGVSVFLRSRRRLTTTAKERPRARGERAQSVQDGTPGSAGSAAGGFRGSDGERVSGLVCGAGCAASRRFEGVTVAALASLCRRVLGLVLGGDVFGDLLECLLRCLGRCLVGLALLPLAVAEAVACRPGVASGALAEQSATRTSATAARRRCATATT